MKLRFLVPTVLSAVLMVACSAEMVGRLPSEDIEIDESLPAIVTTIDSGRVLVRFPLATYANSYAYAVNGGSVVPIDSISYANGYCSVEINLSSESFEGQIVLYASKSENGGDWIQIASLDYILAVTDYVPDAFVSRRGPTSVEIRVNTTSDSNSHNYLVELVGTGGTDFAEKSYEFTGTNVLTISEGLVEDGTYQAKVYLVTTQGPSQAAEMDILAYDPDFESNMDMDVADSSFVVTNLPESAQTVRLMRVISADEQERLLEVNVADGRAVFQFTDLESLDSGRFYAVTESGDGYAVSNLLKYTIPIVPQETHIYRKNIVLDVNLVEGAAPTFVVIGPAGASASYSNGRITISGLTSGARYDSMELRLTNNEYSSVSSYSMSDVEMATFVGNYEWNGKLKAPLSWSPQTSSFKIIVEEANSLSNYPYYVYFSMDDPAVTSATVKEKDYLRIMPLIDQDVDVDSTGNKLVLGKTIDCSDPADGYEKANNAYLTNATKWNSLSSMPTYDWRIDAETSSVSGDSVVTVAISRSIVSGVVTTTTFDFMEIDSDGDGVPEPVIRFRNIGDSTAQMGLYTNYSKADSPYYDSSDENSDYTWYLTLVEEV